MSAVLSERYTAPPPPAEGQVFVDSEGGLWKVRRLTIADKPVGCFYLVHLCHGMTMDHLETSMFVGPREFVALVRVRNLRPHLHSV